MAMLSPSVSLSIFSITSFAVECIGNNDLSSLLPELAINVNFIGISLLTSFFEKS